MTEKNYFEALYNIDVSKKIKEKNSLKFISWAAAWAEVKKMFPEATYKIYEQEFNICDTSTDKNNVTTTKSYTLRRPWFDDGRTCWVKTGVTINGIEHIEELPIMNFQNKSIPANAVNSTDANKSIQRSLTKACARHGLGLYIYEGEDLPEENKKIQELQAACLDLVIKKCGLSEGTKAKVMDICKKSGAESAADIQTLDDLEKLEKLHSELLAVRKVIDKETNKKAQ